MFIVPDFGEHSLWVYILIVCAIIAAIIMVFPKPILTEGFQQSERFLMGTPYDDFYTTHYDIIQDTETRCKTEFELILPYLDTDVPNKKVLDIGCGTGCLLNLLEKANISCTGIDKSPDMVARCSSTLDVVEGDATNPMSFNHGSFTHILCLHHTIYEVEAPKKLLALCKTWLQLDGILVLHIVDKDRFNMVAPCGSTSIIANPQEHLKQRVRKSKVNFIDYLYESNYTTDNTSIVETFTDGASGNIRQYEKPINLEFDAAAAATANGFRFLERKPLPNDQHQWLYFFRAV
jgi:SAM-dependent methyltransferase